MATTTEKFEATELYLRHYFATRVDEHEPPPLRSKDKFAHVATCQIAECVNQRVLRFHGETRAQALMRLEVAAREKKLRRALGKKWELLKDFYTPNPDKRGLQWIARKHGLHHAWVGRRVREAVREASSVLFA